MKRADGNAFATARRRACMERPVALSERTTAGLGCSPGREPIVRVADPEAAGPAHPQRGHGQGQA
ncbi:hypothetical protein EMIHUDRAFT_259763 [Emiliania huxleyi CCMP1516]|uniref:Uncharacterized protein n=2 Tax=Emiliania huxleyi TaxID=2903 RepID=A0A0D3HYA5_EMIH1|nr:hypothetical protein EMIHUDRAFT_259763 [Emiliania huxleyi CCMP1516]EOD03990.1 hypothetical protein EMIHUDRAFT_259763 [Emiliania huxleyi CCMP1516]|eukprot:XP_005756419.1 hypothetical protein EMIHUDRAFT_259763 [Emiliania huxleyi CCMP1516]